MGVPTLEACRERAVQADEKYVEKAKIMREEPQFSEWRAVLDWMVRHGLRLEQESIDVLPEDV